MRIIPFLVCALFLLSSCATILHRKQYDAYVHSNEGNSKIIYNDTIYDLPDTISLKRSKNNLNITLLGDSITRDYTIKPTLTDAFLIYNLIWNYAAPVAYIIDLQTPKRFYYGHQLFFDTNDTSSVIIPEYRKSFEDYFYTPHPTKRNQFNLFISFPHINSFHLKPQGEEPKINTGFWGISLGLEYFYRANKYFTINVNSVSDFYVPIPASPNIEGPYEAMNSAYISVSDNFKFNRFTFGYGLCTAYNLWAVRDGTYMDIGRKRFKKNISKSHYSLGVVVNGYHRIIEDLYFGIIYRPTLLNLQYPDRLRYEYLVSISLGWKFRLNE